MTWFLLDLVTSYNVLIFFKDVDEVVDLTYTPLIVARLGNISVDSVFTDLKKFNRISVQVIVLT